METMACLDVNSVNEKIACIQNLEGEALEKQASLIARDLKGYIYANFSPDEFQRKLIDRVSSDVYKEYGEVLSQAFLNRYSVVAEPSTARAKCPKIKITIELEW